MPWAAIIQAHMLWIEMKLATAGQAIASASKTSAASSRVSPAPPISSGTYIAASPSAARLLAAPRAGCRLSSQASACGAIRSRPKSRARSRIAACSSVSAKSISPPRD